MTTFQYVKSLLHIVGIIMMTVLATVEKSTSIQFFAIVAVCCFTASLIVRLTAVYKDK